MLKRLIYTTPLLWGSKQRADGALIYDLDTIEPLLVTAYKISEDRQLIEFTLRPNAKFANGDPLDAQALKDSCAWLYANGGSGGNQLKVNGLPSAEHLDVVDDVTVRLHLDRPVARDYAVVQTVVFFAALVIVVVNILVDLMYAWLDPRIRVAG